MWQKQQQMGSHLACAPFVNLVELKNLKATHGSPLSEERKVYQTEDIQPWSESMKSVQV